MLNSINPSNGELIASYEEMTKEEVKVIISNVNSAYQEWRLTSFSHRTQLMKNVRRNPSRQKGRSGQVHDFGNGKTLFASSS
jgi:succinate-semialdehyde dehydrogenase/glutarate-semialdehyde dehydrogenase